MDTKREAATTEIEAKITQLLVDDKQTWVKVYELLAECKYKKLYLPQYKNFTAWLNAFAEKMNSSPSTLWHRLKAGKTYTDYFNRALKAGKSPKSLNEVKINPDNLNIIEKIADENEQIADELIEKLLAKRITYSELREIWHGIIQKRKESKEKVTHVNGYDKEPVKAREGLSEASVILALKDNFWLRPTGKVQRGHNRHKVYNGFHFSDDGYKGVLDALVVEVISTQGEDVALHALEIRQSAEKMNKIKQVLNHAKKYVNYVWYVIPKMPDLSELDKLPEEFGVVFFIEDTQEFSIYRHAKDVYNTRKVGYRLELMSQIVQENM